MTRCWPQLCSCLIVNEPCCLHLNWTDLLTVPLPGSKGSHLYHLLPCIDGHSGSWLLVFFFSVRHHKSWRLCLLSLVAHLNQVITFRALLLNRLSYVCLDSNGVEMLDLLSSHLFLGLKLWVCLTVCVKVLASQTVKRICLHDTDWLSLQPKCLGWQRLDWLIGWPMNCWVLLVDVRLGTDHRYSDFAAVISLPSNDITGSFFVCQWVLSRVPGLTCSSVSFLFWTVKINVHRFHNLWGLTFVN